MEDEDQLRKAIKYSYVERAREIGLVLKNCERRPSGLARLRGEPDSQNTDAIVTEWTLLREEYVSLFPDPEDVASLEKAFTCPGSTPCRHRGSIEEGNLQKPDEGAGQYESSHPEAHPLPRVQLRVVQRRIQGLQDELTILSSHLAGLSQLDPSFEPTIIRLSEVELEIEHLNAQTAMLSSAATDREEEAGLANIGMFFHLARPTLKEIERYLEYPETRVHSLIKIRECLALIQEDYQALHSEPFEEHLDNYPHVKDFLAGQI